MFNFIFRLTIIALFLIPLSTLSFAKENNYFISIENIKKLADKFFKSLNPQAIDKIYSLLSQQEVTMGSRFTSTIPVLMPAGTVFYSKSENSLLVAAKNNNVVVKLVKLSSEEGKLLFFEKDNTFENRIFSFQPKLEEGKEYAIEVVVLYLSPNKEVKEVKKESFFVVGPNSNKNLSVLEKQLEKIDSMKIKQKEKFLLKAILFENFALQTGGLYDFSYNRDKYIYLFKNTN